MNWAEGQTWVWTNVELMPGPKTVGTWPISQASGRSSSRRRTPQDPSGPWLEVVSDRETQGDRRSRWSDGYAAMFEGD